MTRGTSYHYPDTLGASKGLSCHLSQSGKCLERLLGNDFRQLPRPSDHAKPWPHGLRLNQAIFLQSCQNLHGDPQRLQFLSYRHHTGHSMGGTINQVLGFEFERIVLMHEDTLNQ